MSDVKKPYWVTIYSLIFIFVFMIFFQNYWKTWNDSKKESPFIYDVDQYYSYLPATFIHHDLDFKYTYRYWLIKAPNGGQVPKMTYGVALMYSPFFLIGHKIAINEGQPLDGYSEPYGTMVHYGTLLYSLLALILVALVLRRFYGDGITAITIVSLFFATNLFHYTMAEGEMAHSYGFFLSALFIWLTCRWHERQKTIYFLWLGLTVGLASLVRPTEILIVLVFVGYEIKSFTELKDKIKKILFSYKNVPLFLIGFFLIWLPQIIFWKMKTDNFLFFSYGSKEKFFWLDPQFANLLLSYRKGWLVYTPIMLFSIVGLFLMKGRSKDFKFSILIYMALNIYVLSCWWCWWFGGGFGMRALVQTYAVMAIPMAAFYNYFFSFNFRKQVMTIFLKGAVVFFFSGFLCLNITTFTIVEYLLCFYTCKFDRYTTNGFYNQQTI